MKATAKILLALLNLAMHYFMVLVFVFIDFFINGSGAQSTVNYEKYKIWWMVSYVIIGLTHLLLFNRYSGIYVKALKAIITFTTAFLYTYYLFQF